MSETNIQITNNTQAVLTNVVRILEFNDIMVKVNTVNLNITVFGCNLRVDDYLSGGLLIYGTIQNIEFNKVAGVK